MRTQFQSPGLLALYSGLAFCIPAGLVAAAAGTGQQPTTTTTTATTTVETAEKHSHKVIRAKVEAPRVPSKPQRPVKQLRPK